MMEAWTRGLRAPCLAVNGTTARCAPDAADTGAVVEGLSCRWNRHWAYTLAPPRRRAGARKVSGWGKSRP